MNHPLAPRSYPGHSFDHVRLLDGRTLLLLLTVALAGCGDAGRDLDIRLPEPPPPTHREPDGLLDRPELQAVVDLQVLRDGAALIERLSDPDPAVRARAALALASVQDPVAVEPLLALLRDSVVAVRADAAFALGQTADSTAGPRLLERFEEEPDPGVRQALLEAMGKTGGAGTLADLLESEVAPEEFSRLAMAFARFGIRGVHDRSVTGWLVASAGRGDPLLRRNAAYAFGRWAETEPWADRAGELRRLLRSYEAADPAAMHLLRAFARVADEGDVDLFAEWVRESPDWRIRVDAARGLGALAAGSAEARELLFDALDDPSAHVSRAAASALGSLALPPNEVERAREWISAHPEPWSVGAGLLPALAVGGRGLAVLDWIRGQDEVVARLAGWTALSQTAQPEIVDSLFAAVERIGPRESAGVFRALGTVWERESEGSLDRFAALFRAGLEDDDWRLRSAAAQALSDPRFLEFGSLEALLVALERERLVQGEPPSAIFALPPLMTAVREGTAGESAEVEASLREALADSRPAVRSAAAQALGELLGEEVEFEPASGEAERRIEWERLAELGRHPRLILDTDRGEVVLHLDPEEAPLTVQTITDLAASGEYDGVPFHRVVPNFVVQGGDVGWGDGTGGPGFDIRSEFTRIPYQRGILGMASAGKDTEGSQFFITHSMQPHLDGSYTAFGWVDRGMSVVDVILLDDRIRAARVVPDRGEGGEETAEADAGSGG